MEDEEERRNYEKEVESLLNLLTNKQREVIYLRFIKALSIQEISEILNITPKSVRKMIYRAIERMQQGKIELLFLLMFLEINNKEGQFYPSLALRITFCTFSLVPERSLNKCRVFIYLILIDRIPIEFTLVDTFDILRALEECSIIIWVIRQLRSTEIHTVHRLIQHFFRFLPTTEV